MGAGAIVTDRSLDGAVTSPPPDKGGTPTAVRRATVAPREEGRDRHPPVISRQFSIMAARERLPRARRSRAPGPPTADHPLGGPTMSIGGIVLALVIGLVAGLIARAVVPGKQ